MYVCVHTCVCVFVCVYQVIWRCDINKKWKKERHSATETKPPITLRVVPQATLVAAQEEEAKIKENKEEKWATKNKETYSLKKKNLTYNVLKIDSIPA